MRNKRLLVAALALALAAPTGAPAAPSGSAEAYFAQAVKLLRDKHINSARADWNALEKRARSQLGDAQTSADTYPAIRFLLKELGEKHSFLMEPRPPLTAQATDESAAPAAPSLPSSRLIDRRFALVSLPALDTMGGGREATGPAYAKALSSALQRMDGEPLCGWIVDLRENGGGNMWPMLQGLDPLLGEAPFGQFITQGGGAVPWVRTANGIFPYAGELPRIGPAFSLAKSALPLAVLLGPRTASSGEMVAIGFAGRAGVRSFGQPSAGFATGNTVHPLGDGAYLGITEVTVRDRRGRGYDGPITPDEPVDPEQAEAAAIRWLDGQCPR